MWWNSSLISFSIKWFNSLFTRPSVFDKAVMQRPGPPHAFLPGLSPSYLNVVMETKIQQSAWWVYNESIFYPSPVSLLYWPLNVIVAYSPVVVSIPVFFNQWHVQLATPLCPTALSHILPSPSRDSASKVFFSLMNMFGLVLWTHCQHPLWGGMN